MMELVLATTNQGKFQQLKDALEPLHLVIRAITEYDGSEDIEIQENGKIAQENARIKATTYACKLETTVLSMDSGLYLAGLPDEHQPGIFVRRIFGEGDYLRPSDRELLAYYSGLITGLGGCIDGHWEFGICIATPIGETFETTLMTPRKFVNRPSREMVAGFPLESLQIDRNSGKYIAEMTREEKAKFWQKLLGEQLCEFVRETLKLASW